MNKPNVIAFGYAKRAFDSNSRERHRLKEYSDTFGSFHLVVFTKKSDGFPNFVKDGNLYIYATNANTRIGAVLFAYWCGRRIIKSNTAELWTVSSQDPFETSIPAVLLSIVYKAALLHIQIHGDVFNKEYAKKTLYNALLHFYSVWVVKRARKIRVVSKRIKDDLIKLGVASGVITVLPVQSDIQPFFTVGRERTFLDLTPVKLLFVGRFSPEKNIPLLLKAVAFVHNKGIAVTLDLLGEGSQRQVIDSLITALKIENIVTITPWTEDVPTMMSQADIFCLSSWHEGFAMVLIEAMAAGMPIITTDVGCVGECVIDTKEAMVVSPDDVEGFAHAIETLALDRTLREKYGKAGHLKAREVTMSQDAYLQEIQRSFTV